MKSEWGGQNQLNPIQCGSVPSMGVVGCDWSELDRRNHHV